jgi:hypothetical protein
MDLKAKNDKGIHISKDEWLYILLLVCILGLILTIYLLAK